MPKNLLFGITGSIAAYKTIDLIHQLTKEGFNCKCILTEQAQSFITPLTIETLSKNRVFLDHSSAPPLGHIELSSWADIMIIAPITANTLAKLSIGMADNILTETFLALPITTPRLLAPAMNTRMWDNPITQANINSLTNQITSLSIISPRESTLACETTGMGAMATCDTITEEIKNKL
jgi:phosphopantothenoylcysteine decarboxylase